MSPRVNDSQLSCVSVILPSAGLGLRMGGDARPKNGESASGVIKKPFLHIKGKPILLHTFEKFASLDCVREIILVVNPDDHASVAGEWSDRLNELRRTKIIPGGRRRQDSVYNGLLESDDNCDIVLVHDAVRPFVTKEIIESVVQKVEECGAAIAAVPMKATVKQVGADRTISRTVPRDDLWMAQTPQGFKRNIILDAFKKLIPTDAEVTDDAEVAERFGYKVAIVNGSDDNIKITTPEDLALAVAIAGE